MRIRRFQFLLYLACIGVVLVTQNSCQPAIEPGLHEETTQRTEHTETAETVTEDPVSEITTDPSTDTVAEETGIAETEPTETEPIETEIVLNTEIYPGAKFAVDFSYEPTYEVLDTGLTQYLRPKIPSANHVTEIDFRPLLNMVEEIENPVPQPAESADIQIGDQMFPATYQGTFTPTMFPSAYHSYRGIDDYGTTYYIKIDAETGMVIGFSYDIPKGREDETKPLLTESECYDIAVRFLFEDGDLSREQYQLTESVALEYRYSYYFKRVVDGMETEESVEISVTNRGRIFDISTIYFGNMDGVTALPDYDKAEVIKSMERKMLDIYGTLLEQHTGEYMIERENRIVRLYDEGELYLLYGIEVLIDGVGLDWCDFLVRIE